MSLGLGDVPVEALHCDPGVGVEDREAEEDQTEISEFHLREISVSVILHIPQDLVKETNCLLIPQLIIWRGGEVLDCGLQWDVLWLGKEEEDSEKEGDVEEVQEEPGEGEAPAVGLGWEEERQVGQEEEGEVELAGQVETVDYQVSQQEEQGEGDTDAGQGDHA